MPNRRRFTDVMIERLRPPSKGRTEIGDAVVQGLVLRITQNNVRSWSAIYKVPGGRGMSERGNPLAGRQQRITLGRYPLVGITAARERAQEILRQVAEGHDPRPDLQRAREIRLTNTVEAVARRFHEAHARRNASGHLARRTIELHALPTLGDRPMRDVTRGDISQLLDDLVAQDMIGAARETRKHLSTLFNWALDRDIVATNPVPRVGKNSPLRPNDSAGRALTDKEIGALWAAAAVMGYPYGHAVRLLLLTGKRRAEWMGARRSWIDTSERLIEIPAEHYKSRHVHVVPLAASAWEIIKDLPKFRGNNYFIFSGTHGKKAISGFSKSKARLNGLMAEELNGELKDFRLHDLRVTCETRLASLGFNSDVQAAVLGHAKTGLGRIYNKHDYLDEKRAALTAYAEHITELVG